MEVLSSSTSSYRSTISMLAYPINKRNLFVSEIRTLLSSPCPITWSSYTPYCFFWLARSPLPALSSPQQTIQFRRANPAWTRTRGADKAHSHDGISKLHAQHRRVDGGGLDGFRLSTSALSLSRYRTYNNILFK